MISDEAVEAAAREYERLLTTSDPEYVPDLRSEKLGEEWRSIPGYERTYLISSEGRVKSTPRPRTKGGLLAIKKGKRGYPAVSLVQNGRQSTHEVHRLVALAFIGPPRDGLEVRHKDGNSFNPCLNNLEYGTRAENSLDKQRHGTDHQKNKMHCPQGHPYDAENTIRIPSRPNARYCRTCNVEQKRQAQIRKTQVLVAAVSA